MPRTEDDRLLSITRLILTVLLGLSVLAGAVALAMIPILLLRREEIGADFAAQGIDPGTVPIAALMLALGFALAALSFFFTRHLRRIVDSVSQGDPFVPVNADRLRNMAWLALGVQAVLFAAAPLLFWFDALPHKPNVHYESDGFSFGALILALLLFVLARVFRVGSEMREELEGTV